MKIKYATVTMLSIALLIGCKQKQEQQTPQAFALPPSSGTERDWQDVIHLELSKKEGWESLEKEHRLDDGTRVDLLFPFKACEIDWADKWAEGVGQSVYYGLKTKKLPLVILLAKKDGWEKYRDRVQYCGVECWVYDTRLQDWLDKE
tara:strand:+ start:947 stop:1387 length:441 start_codon:yes stop_codon:yes gene_type:complete